MNHREFITVRQLKEATRLLLEKSFSESFDNPSAVLLPGGNTPQGIYRELTTNPPRLGGKVHLGLTDERHVPWESPDSNYGQLAAMIRALGIAEDRVLKVRTNRPLDEAAAGYAADWKTFLDKGGRITLALLGLGPDGHTASLFSAADVQAGAGRLAQAIRRPMPPDRVSVTRDLLRRAERIVFLAAGPDKAAVVSRLAETPAEVTAGLAVDGCANVEIWYSPENLV